MIVLWAMLSVVVLVFAHWFLYARLAESLASVMNRRVRRGLRLLTLGLILLVPVGWMASKVLPARPAGLLHLVAAVWLGVLWHLFWMSCVLYLIRLILRASGVWRHLAPHERLIGQWGVIVVMLTAIVLSVAGISSALGKARVIHVSVPVKNLSPELRRIRIVAASDFHAGALTGTKAVERMVTQIQELRPGLILLAGDLLDRKGSHRPELQAAFSKLRAPYGVLGCTGNHEYYAGIDSSLGFCRRAGVYMLTNKLVRLPGGLVVAGYDDPAADFYGRRRPPLDSLLQPAVSESPTILLMHTPRTREVRAAIEAGVDLVISGHTHGGQVWPFSLFTRLAFRYHHGLYRVGKGHALTTCGIGYWGTPMRLGARPEILVIQLVSEGETTS